MTYKDPNPIPLKSHSMTYYKNYIDCDFCGRATRGEVFLDFNNQPTGGVFCSGCHGRLIDDIKGWDGKEVDR